MLLITIRIGGTEMQQIVCVATLSFVLLVIYQSNKFESEARISVSVYLSIS